jgi:dTDP-glucose pyrophosphorylase
MVILTINGKGTRFLKEGILQPKFMLPYKNSTIIECILKNLKIGFPQGIEIFIGLNKCYEETRVFIGNACAALELQSQIMMMDDSKGQADTARMILEHFRTKDTPFWIVNCDTLVEGSWRLNYPKRNIIVEVFDSDSPNYSYIDNVEKVSHIAEKKVISRHASTGNYYFDSTHLFLNLYKSTISIGEIFISDVINEGLRRGLSVSGQYISSKQVRVLGTPQQYHACR